MTERDTLRVSVLGQQVLLQCAQRGQRLRPDSFCIVQFAVRAECLHQTLGHQTHHDLRVNNQRSADVEGFNQTVEDTNGVRGVYRTQDM